MPNQFEQLLALMNQQPTGRQFADIRGDQPNPFASIQDPNLTALNFAQQEMNSPERIQQSLTESLDDKIETGKTASTIKNALSSFEKLQDLFDQQSSGR